MDEERFRRIQQILDMVRQSTGVGLRPPRRYEGDPADLLQEGRIDFAPAVAITLYFDGPLGRFGDGVVACWEEFAGEWESGLRWYADQKLGKWRPCTAKMLRRPIDQIAKRNPVPFNAWYATSAETYQSASPVTFSAIVRDSSGGDLSYVRATFPAARVAGEAAAAGFLETTKRWCERIPIRHGYAGLTVNEASQRATRQMNSGMLPQIAERFPGVEIDDCEGTVLVARDRIKGVNWLTLLGDELVQHLGGLPALSIRLSDAVALHAARDGAVIVQAGRVPTRGDTQSGDDLSLYREVARVLRPISLESHPDLGTVEFGSFGTEGTNRWLRRFE